MRRERKSLFRLFFLLFPNQRFTIVLFFFDFWVDMLFALAIDLALALIAVYITIHPNIFVSSERIKPTELKKKLLFDWFI